MIATAEYQEIAKYAGSVGLLVDRAVKREIPFGTAWLVDTDIVATCAHLVVLYEEMLPALKVRFPVSNQSWEIVEAKFHPRFDRRVAEEMAQRSLSGPVPAMALQDHNLVLLKLSRSLSELQPGQATSYNRKLSIPPLPRVKGLVGSVDELGLALVIQTMTTARKDGVLHITDERNRPVAKLFCKDGRVLFAKFGRLANEMAVYQMFIHNLSGQFNFVTQESPDWHVSVPMARPTDGLLLEAHRRLDEVPRLTEMLGGQHVSYRRAFEALNPQLIAEEVRHFAARIWPHLDGGLSIGQLWESVDLDDYAVYATLVELLNSNQIIRMPAFPNGSAQMVPLQMGPAQLLSPWDEVINLTVDAEGAMPQLRTGNLVGLLRPNDPYHLLHSLRLPYKAAGSPLFKKGQVIGMHCGMLPLDPELHALPQHLHQMVWVESVQQCLLNEAAAKQAKPSKKSLGMVRPQLGADNGQIVCPKCHSVMIKQARFCGTCGQKF